MVSIEEVLSKVSEGRTVAAISKQLDMREATLRAMLEFMVEKGYLEEIHCRSGCEGCAMSRKCSIPAPGDRDVKMYALTNRGMEYINPA